MSHLQQLRSLEKEPSVLIQPILTSPKKYTYQTRSQHQAIPTPPELATISEGGHTGGKKRSTSEGASEGTQPFFQKFVPRRFTGYGECQSGHNIMHKSLDQHNNEKCCCSSNHTHVNGILIKYPIIEPLWRRGFGNELGCIFHSIHHIKGTSTFLFFELTNIPKDRQIIYGKIVCDYKPRKKQNERVRLTVGGDRLDYYGEVSASTADIATFKILINSTLSTENAKMMMMDITKYYLGTPLPRYEYMRMLLSSIPEEIINNYNIRALAVDGWVNIKIRKGMYGVQEEGLLENQLLQKHGAPLG
jgi:hypothetical protein